MRLLFQLFEQIPTKEHIVLKPKEQKLIKDKAPFTDEISGLATVIILDRCTYSTMLIELKFMSNAATLNIINNGTETIIYKTEEMLGILDLKFLGYYKIKQGILQQNLSKYYKFERADTVCEHFNTHIEKGERTGRNKRELSMVRSK